MRVQIQKENLAYGLSLVSRAVASRATNPILEHVLLATEEDKLRLAATDLELAITCVVDAHKVEEHGAAAVRARPFSELVQTLTESVFALTYESQSAMLQILAGNAKAQFKCMDVDEFPPLPVPEMDHAVRLDPEVFREIVDQVVFAAAKEEARPVLTGVSVRTRDGRLAFAATDGFRLAVRWVTLDGAAPEGWDFILPARSLKELDRIVAKTEAEVAIQPLAERRQVAFRTGAVDVLSQLIEGAYPNYEALIPSSANTRVLASKELFLQACRQAQIFTRERFNEAVRLVIQPGEEGPGMIQVIAQDEELGSTQVNVAAVVEGEAMTVGFNVRFLREALEAIPSGEVSLELIAPASPAVLRPVGRDDYVHIIMPMQIQ